MCFKIINFRLTIEQTFAFNIDYTKKTSTIFKTGGALGHISLLKIYKNYVIFTSLEFINALNDVFSLLEGKRLTF